MTADHILGNSLHIHKKKRRYIDVHIIIQETLGEEQLLLLHTNEFGYYRSLLPIVQ